CDLRGVAFSSCRADWRAERVIQGACPTCRSRRHSAHDEPSWEPPRRGHPDHAQRRCQEANGFCGLREVATEGAMPGTMQRKYGMLLVMSPSRRSVAAYYASAPVTDWTGSGEPAGDVLRTDLSPEDGIRVEPRPLYRSRSRTATGDTHHGHRSGEG